MLKQLCMYTAWDETRYFFPEYEKPRKDMSPNPSAFNYNEDEGASATEQDTASSISMSAV